MTFLLRRIATTADGREIVRAAPIDQPRLTIGRDAASDIHLPDLAVNPAHATIGSDDGRHLLVEAVSGLGFDVDGRSVMRATIDAAQGAELRFGGHRITVGRDESGERARISLTIARTDELSHSALDRDEARAFSLAGLLPGRRISAWVFGLLVLAAFIAAPIYAFMHWRNVEQRPRSFHADMSWSSGPLSSAHASLARDCQSCHTEAFVAVTDSSCQSCHTDAHNHAPIARQIAARGEPGAFRAALLRVGAAFNRPRGRCVDCHTEHEGAGRMPPTAQRFCSDCHDGMSGRLPDTRIGDAGDFGTSHPEFRPQVATAPGNPPSFRRVALNAQTVDRNGLRFPHDLHLSRNGGVARMARSVGIAGNRGGAGAAGLECATCHKPTPDGVRFQPVDMERDCQSCHSLSFENIGGTMRTLRHGQPAQVAADLAAYYRSTPPTRPINLGGMARRRPGAFAAAQTSTIYFRETSIRPSRADAAVRAVFSRGGVCAECHITTPPAAGNGAWRITPVNQTQRYLNHGWFDHQPHRQEPCSTCHLATRSSSADQLLVPGIKVCRDCHGGEGSGADVESPCASCHTYHPGGVGAAPWRPDRTRSPNGAHPAARSGAQPAGHALQNRGRVTAVTTRSSRQIYGGY